MPIDVQMPDGTIISGVPDNITQADLLARYKAYVPPTPQEAVGGARKPEDIGFVERNIGAAKRGVEQLGDITGGLGLAGTALTGTEAETTAKMQQIKREQAVPQETPGYTAADIERIYKKEGLLSAAGAVPSYITEQILQSAPSMAVPLAAGAAATAVSAPLGPAAPVVGALVGVGAYGVQQFGNFLTRQAIEKKDAKELDLLKAAGTAAATAPLGYFADRFTAGLGGIGTKKAGEEILKELSARQVAAKVGKRAAGGATAGIIAEAPLEVLEQAAERYQAGLSLTGDDAANEYKEAFFGAAAAGAGIGGASRAIQAYQTPVKPGTTETSKGPSEEEQRARFAFLNAIGSGTEDQIITDENGNKVKIPGQLKRYFTPKEQAEYDQLKQKFGPTTSAPSRAAPPSAAQDTQAMIDEISGLPPAAPPTTPPTTPPADTVPPAAPVGNEIWQTIQNRDRSSPASIAQMTNIANVPDYSRLSMSRSYSTGAPIVAGADIDPLRLGRKDPVVSEDGKKVPIQFGVIEAGDVIASHNVDGTKNPAYIDQSVPSFRAITNGRIAGLQAAYRQGTADTYKADLLADDFHGIDKSVIEGMQNPILVRVMPMDQVNKNTGDVSNTGAGLTFNVVEQAKNDTNRLDLSTVKFTDSGDISPQTVRDFIAAMPTTEQGNLIGKDGNPTKQAVERVDAAIFQQAYNNDKLTELAFQAQDEEARNIVRALNMAASKAIRLDQAGDYDVRPLVNEAVEMAINARRNNMALKDVLAQGDLTANPLAKDIVQMFADNPRSAKAIGENLSNLFDNAFTEGSKTDEDMFGAVPKRPLDELIKTSFTKEKAPDLFDETQPAAEEKPAVEEKEPKDFDISKTEFEIHQEIKDLDSIGLAKWLVANARNKAAKYIAEKLEQQITKFEKAGVKVNIIMLNGKDRHKRGVQGTSGLKTGPNREVYYNVRINGLNTKGKADDSTIGYQILMHELLHTVSQLQIYAIRDRKTKDYQEIQKDLASILRAVRKQNKIEATKDAVDQHNASYQSRFYKNTDELFAYGLSNSSLQDYLSTIKVGDKTAFTKLVEIVRKLLGISAEYDTALDKLMRVGDRVFQMSTDEIADIAKQVKMNFGEGALPSSAGTSISEQPTLKTDTPQFKKFFGDSKVVNEDGTPKVVYHGTDRPDFSIFDPASWFSENPAESSMYARPGDLKKREKLLNKYKLSDDTSAVGKYVPLAPVLQDFGKLEEGKLYAEGGEDGPVYKYLGNNKFEVLSNVVVDLDNVIDNPDGTSSILLKEGRSQQAIDEVKETKDFAQSEYPGGESGRVYPVYLSIKNPLRLSALEANSFSERLGMSKKDIQDQVNKWKAQGYDGIITTSDEATVSVEVRNAFGGIPEQYIPFDSNQIKSAIGNTGEYSASPNITQGSMRGIPNIIKKLITKKQPEAAKETVDTEKPAATARNYLGQPVEAAWAFPEDKFIKVPGAPEQSIDKLLYIFQDKQIDLKRAQQGIAKAAGEITDNINAYDKEQLFHGKVATGIRNFLLNELMPAIKKIKEFKLTTKDMQDYLLARHAEERNNRMNELNKLDPRTGEPRKTPWELQDRASGMSTADAREYLKNLDPAKKQSLETIGNMFDKMITGTQKILVDSGSESQATIDAWNEAYEHYMPLFRVEEDFNNGGNRSGLSKGFNVSSPFSKRAMGSEKEVQNIVNNLIKQRERALIRAEKLTVLKALYGLFLMNPNPDIALPVNPDAIKSKDALITELEGLGYDNAAEIANNLMEEPKTRYISKGKRVIDKITGLPTSDTEDSVQLRIDSLNRFGDNVITLRVDGKNRYIFFKQDNPNAVRMANSLKSLDTESLGTVMSIVAKGTRWFANVNTQYNPIFAAVNLIRDVGSAQFNLTTTPLAGKQAQVTAGIFPAMRGIFKVLRAERGGEVGGDSAMEKAFREFREAGGQTGYRDSITRKEGDLSIIDDMLKTKTLSGNALKAMKSVFNALSDFNDTLENSIRLSAYIQASKPKSEGGLGLSKQQAAVIAKNLTVNFDKKGQISANVNALYAFFNASVQGTARLATTLTGPKGKAIIGGGILAGSMQSILLAMAGFREDEPPEFVKQRNFIIPTPDGNYLTIPYPLGFNLLPNIGRITTEFMISGGKNPAKRAGDLLGSVADAFSPIGSSGLSIQTIAPTVLDPLAAIEANKDAFGRPIYKEDRATNPTPGYLRSRENASEMSNAISYFLNLASGGTKYSKGFVSPTGDEIDYVIGQVTGGLGREIMKTGQTIKAAGTGEDLPAYRVPLLGRFYGETESNAAESQRFYNNITRMADHENEIKGRIKNKESVAAYYRDNPEARLYQQANTIENQINALNKQKKEFIERDLPKERIKRIENQKAAIMKRFNDRLARFED
jgi:hypothetical protein